MDAVLIILGILGIGAILISAYVFTVAARNYVSEDQKKYRRKAGTAAPYHMVARNLSDRRAGQTVAFPLTVNGILITHDRRHIPDRRAAA
ncbi:MAG: hypothetical protein ACI9JM_000078 [Halioglobus sp.]|jgi:hypothetical protein